MQMGQEITRTCSACGEFFVVMAARVRHHKCVKCKIATNDRKSALAGAPLTPREQQLASLVALGLSNKEIAYELHLEVGTVKVYFSRIYKKFQIANRTSLALEVDRQIREAGECVNADSSTIR